MPGSIHHMNWGSAHTQPCLPLLSIQSPGQSPWPNCPNGFQLSAAPLLLQRVSHSIIYIYIQPPKYIDRIVIKSKSPKCIGNCAAIYLGSAYTSHIIPPRTSAHAPFQTADWSDVVGGRGKLRERPVHRRSIGVRKGGLCRRKRGCLRVWRRRVA